MILNFDFCIFERSRQYSILQRTGTRLTAETLLKTLIDIPSLTGDEQRIGAFLATHLESGGWRVTRQGLDNGRFNIHAVFGKPAVTFSTHMDTVGPHIACREEGGRIYGRGACDAKGSLAAQITAADILKESGTAIGLLFVVGEERGSDGAIKANTIANTSRFLINGEPTGNRFASGTKGVLRLKLSVEGVAAHSAYPEEGTSAVGTLIEVLQTLLHYSWPRDSVLGETTLNIGTISGGEAANIIPAHAESEIMFRTVQDTGEMLHLTSNIVKGRAAMKVLYRCDPVHLFCPEGYECGPVAFATDINSLSDWGTPLLFGPGSIKDAHTMHEQITKEDLQAAVHMYVRMCRRLMQS